METEIATLNLQAISHDGVKTDIHIGVGAPIEEPDGTWSCEIDAETVRKNTFKIYGGDSMQALCLALDLVRSELLRLGKGGRLLFEADAEGGQDIVFPLKAYFPGVHRH